MNILAIETSCEHASVALLSGGDMLERPLEGHVNHSEYLLPTLRGLLAEAQISLTQLDAIAFGSGPGAFTGLRLACAVTQGLAMGAGLGVVPVSSLAALSLQAGAECVFVATDARMGEVYSAAYRVVDSMPTMVREVSCSPPELVPFPQEGRWSVIGSALRAHSATLAPRWADRAAGWNDDAAPRASDVARIAACEISAGRVLAPEQAAPVYVRDKVALTTRERLARGGRA
jgi:tRNA threonylcarbamoyladenosine biosynthesis protein TsaB